MKKGNEIKSFRDLLAYQEAYKLCLMIYESTKSFPKEEIYGLVSQMRRSAVSIPSNISEGYRRRKIKEYVHFLRIALGSHAELETQISLSTDLGFLPIDKTEELTNLADSVGRLLYRLTESLEE